MIVRLLNPKCGHRAVTGGPSSAAARVLPGAFAAMALAAAVSLGCRPGGQSASPEPLANQVGTKTPGPNETEPSAGQPAPSSDLRDMCRRVCHFTEGEIRNYKNRLITHGLAPLDRIELAVQPAAFDIHSPQKTLLANRVCAVLADELGRLGGLSASVRTEHPRSDGARLTVDVSNNFETEAFFDCFHVQIKFQLADGEKPVEYTDSFASEGLVRVVSSSETSETLFITAEKPDNHLVLDFAVKPGEWFLLPAGIYRRITVRSKAGLWRAPATVGIQNLWDLSTPSATGVGETGGPSRAPNAAVPRLATPQRGSDESRSVHHLQILSPTDGARVPRRCDVSGVSDMEGASVQVVVSPFGDVEYPQDGQGLVRNGSWRVRNCLFGRPGQDSGQQFYVKARSPCPDGAIVESTIAVTRE